MGCILLVTGQRGPMDTPEHHRLLPRLLVVHHNLMVRPCCEDHAYAPEHKAGT